MPFGADTIDRLVLDTSAYSRLRAGDPRAIAVVAEAPLVLVPAVVLGELEAAFELGGRPVENRARLAEFLAEPFVLQVNVTPTVARRYGQLFAALRRAGTPIPVNDIWIAALTLEQDGHLLTFDTDFERVPSLHCTVLAVT
jgi:tRNA(fMet)-specific endonuclease VapC